MLSTVFGICESDNGSFGGQSLPDVTVDELLNDDDVNAAYEENSIETAARIVYENTYNWNTIVEASEIEELHVLESTGVAAINEATVGGFFEKAKEFFRNIWKKIQELFKKAIMQFKSFSKSDKEFISKYKADINRARNTKNFGDVEFAGYNYVFLGKDATKEYGKGLAAGITEFSNVGEAASKIFNVAITDITKEKLAEMDTDKVTEILDAYRAGFCQGETSVTAGEFKKTVLEKLQGDSTTESKPLGDWVTNAIAFLEGSSKIESGLNEILKLNKKAIDASIKVVETAQKAYGKELKEADKEAQGLSYQYCQKIVSVLQAERSIEVAYNGIALQALKSCSRQCKAVCVKVVSTKSQKSSTAYGESTSLLGGLELI